MLRVTEILREAGMVDYAFSNEEAKVRGTYVHTACGMIDKGSLDWEGLDPILLPFCQAYRKYLDDTQHPEVILSEARFDHPQYQYTGQLDRILRRNNGGTFLVDIKTGAAHPAVDLQVAAYRELPHGHPVVKCYVLYLRNDATYRLVESKDHRKNFNIFLAALSIVRWRKEML
jgi:hypothetical protein